MSIFKQFLETLFLVAFVYVPIIIMALGVTYALWGVLQALYYIFGGDVPGCQEPLSRWRGGAWI